MMTGNPADAAYKALESGDKPAARRHALAAAKQAFEAAESVTGDRRRQLIEDGEGWLRMIEKLEPGGGQSAPSRDHRSAPTQSEDPPGQSSEWEVRERPDTRLSDVAGLEDVKQAIREMVLLPLARPDWADALKLPAGGGVLLYGPPGNGKTLLGRAIAGELDVPFFFASGAQIRSKWHGESEQRMRQLMQAVKSHERAVLFLDEVDGLLARRSSESAADNRLVTQFLSEMGGFSGTGNATLLLGATNCPWDIDDAVFRTGRFDVKIHVGLPDLPARKYLLESQLDLPGAQVDVSTDSWAERLDGYCGSDLAGLVNSAKRRSLGRAIESDSAPALMDADLEASLGHIRPSATDSLLKRYASFQQANLGG